MEENKLNPTGAPEEGADTLADKIADKVEAIGDTAEDIGGKVADTVTDVVEAAGETADEFGDKVADVVKGTEDAAAGAVEGAADAAASESASFGDKVAGVVNAAGEAADSFGDKVADTVSETFGGADKAISPDAIYGGAPAAGGSKVLSIVSLVLGILSIVSSFCCCAVGVPCGIFGIAAIVTGFISKKKNCEGQGMALAGIITGAAGIVIGVIVLALSLLGIVGGNS